MTRTAQRHTLHGIPFNVNLVDVIEYIVDCVMAGKARTGVVYDLNINPDMLLKAFQNTIELLKNNVTVIEEI